MSIHMKSAFNNTCIKRPINPFNKRPCPNYEKYIRPNSIDKKMEHNKSDEIKQCSDVNDKNLELYSKDNIFSLVEFYDSIPDYKDINHLSKEEFDHKLDTLKRKQNELSHCLNYKKDNPLIESNQQLLVDTPKNENNNIFDNNNISPISWTHERNNNKKLSNKNVRINSAKSNTFSLRSDLSCSNLKYNCDDLCIDIAKKCRSKSSSPIRCTPRLTVPKPFKMTQREEEEEMLQDLMAITKSVSPREYKDTTERNIIKANPVPITSKIPMYKQICSEQEHRNQLAKLNSKIELQSQMKPFTFTEKSDRHPNLNRSLTSPQLSTVQSTNEPENNKANHCFRAKPFPKNFFSNYFYHKMWEDEYFRTLNRKLRAEELLKISTLPPSMRKRDKSTTNKKHNIKTERCISSATSCGNGIDSKRSYSSHGKRKKRSKKKIPDYCHLHEKIKNSLDEKQSEFITTCPDPFEFETEKRCVRRTTKTSSNASHSSKLSNSSTNFSPMPMYPAARPNLAANLRAQWSRKKLQELSLEPQKTFPKEKLRRPSWGVRKSPAWKSLYFDHTNDEDISLRLATRQAEQKLRQDEHQLNMELMRQRVRAAPLLLEGQTYWGPKVGKVSHSCTCHTTQKYSATLPNDKTKRYCYSERRNHSKLSNYSELKNYDHKDEFDEHLGLNKEFL